MEIVYSGRKFVQKNYTNWCDAVGVNRPMTDHSLPKLYNYWSRKRIMHTFMSISIASHRITYSHRQCQWSLGTWMYKIYGLLKKCQFPEEKRMLFIQTRAINAVISIYVLCKGIKRSNWQWIVHFHRKRIHYCHVFKHRWPVMVLGIAAKYWFNLCMSTF